MLQKTLWLILFCLGFAVGDKWGEVKLARLESSHAEAERSAAEAALYRLRDADARADFLMARIAAAEQSRQSIALEHQREIKRLTVGRPCLGAAVVRVLNEPASATEPAPLPAAAGEPAAADDRVATDTDVAYWADLARRQYDTCRDRVQALIDWHRTKADDRPD